jgi:hypothetical protein
MHIKSLWSLDWLGVMENSEVMKEKQQRPTCIMPGKE